MHFTHQAFGVLADCVINAEISEQKKKAVKACCRGLQHRAFQKSQRKRRLLSIAKQMAHRTLPLGASDSALFEELGVVLTGDGGTTIYNMRCDLMAKLKMGPSPASDTAQHDAADGNTQCYHYVRHDITRFLIERFEAFDEGERARLPGRFRAVQPNQTLLLLKC